MNLHLLLTFIRKKLVLMALFAISSLYVSASHSAGGYLSYQWLYGNTYRFTVTFYKDCAGTTPAPTQMEIDVNSSCGTGSVLASMVAGTGQEIGYTCPNATTCTGGSNPGYRKYVYQVDATFNITCTDWKVSFKPSAADNQRLGRNNAITTLVPSCYDIFNGYTQCNLYTEAYLDNVNYPTNATVTFNNDPILFVCAGQSAIFNMGAVDPDGDSLAYDLIPAKQDINSNVVYVSPLSGFNPLFPVGSVIINGKTGDISINTSTTQVGVLAILVKEYRNGIFVGSTILDIQVVVQNCSNNNTYPSVSGINGTSLYADTVCPGSTVSFVVNSSDPDAGQVVTMIWDNGIPAATFNSSGGSLPSGTFIWNTTTGDARQQPYTFTVTVTDNACPSKGFQTRSYSIYVIDLPVSVTPSSANVCNGGSVTLTASGAGNYTWSPSTGLSSTTGASVIATPATTTTYSVTGSGSGCIATSTVVVTVTPLAPVAGPDTLVCYGNFVQFHASGGTNYSWSPSVGLSDPNIADPIAFGTGANTYTVTVSTGVCVGTATVSLGVHPEIPVPVITQSQDTLSCSIDASYSSFQWYFDNQVIPGATDHFYKALQSGNYNVAVTDTNGCQTSVGINIVLGVGLNDLHDHAVSIFPNPVHNTLTIYGLQAAAIELVVIYNVLGEIVMSSVPVNKNGNNIAIDATSLSSGMYFVAIKSDNLKWTGKFIKE